MKKRPTLKIYCDTETYKITDPKDNETLVRPYLIGWYCEGKFYYSFEPHDKFFDFLREKYKTYSLDLWWFNAMYDLPILYPEFLKKYITNHQINFKVSENKRFISFTYHARKLAFTCYDAAVWNPHHRLEDWAKMMGHKAQKVKGLLYDKWNLTTDLNNNVFRFNNTQGVQQTSCIDFELKYLENDVKILADIVEYQQKSKEYLSKEVLGLSRTIKANTSASFGKKAINEWKKKLHGESNYFDTRFRPIVEDRETYMQMINSSKGGFTACNTEITDAYSPEGNIVSYDVTSHYPAIMVNGMPAGELLEKPPQTVPYCTWYLCTMSHCKWKEILSYISTTPYSQEWCKLEDGFWLLKDLYDTVNKYLYTDLEIVDTMYQEITSELAPFYKDLIREKMRIDKDTTDPDRDFKRLNIKILLNSGYGKCCEKSYIDQTIYSQDDNCFITKPDLNCTFRSPMTGVYIAQKGRAILLQALLTEILDNGNIFYYCDTDSIKMLQNNPPKFKIHQTKLGYFKHEGNFTHYKSTGKTKKWYLGNEKTNTLKWAFSGISRETQASLIECDDPTLMHLLFDPENNVSIKDGKKGKERNKWDQIIITNIDICVNGNVENKTHEIEFSQELRKWLIKTL